MSNSNSAENINEIDLKELLLILWRGKYLIFLITVLAIGLSSIQLRKSERKYSVEVIFKPVIEGQGSGNLSGLSGLASFAGISLPTSSSSDFTTYQMLMFSEEVAERIFANRALVLKLFKGEWRADKESFQAPKPGRISELKQSVKLALIGGKKREYIAPNPKRLSILISGTLGMSIDGTTGFLSIATETNEPDLMLELISVVSQETDNLLKERFLATAEDALGFYYKKLLTSQSPEHREALAKLISAEDQKLMLASKSSNFVAEPLTIPSVSLYPTWPRPSLFLAVGFLVGIFFGAVVVITRHALKNPKVN
jgi:hypothetical protein